MHRLHLEPLLDAAAERLLVVEAAELGQDTILMGFILIPAGIDLGNQGVKVRIRSQGSLGNQFFSARGTLLIPGKEKKNNQKSGIMGEVRIPTEAVMQSPRHTRCAKR